MSLCPTGRGAERRRPDLVPGLLSGPPADADGGERFSFSTVETVNVLKLAGERTTQKE